MAVNWLYDQSKSLPRFPGGQFIETVDFDGDGDVDVLSASFSQGRISWHENRFFGDSNDDGVFTSDDLTHVFIAGKYNDGIPNNATFAEGDWNQDGDFDEQDIVAAFIAGHYVADGGSSASAPVAAIDAAHTDEDAKRAFVA